MKITFTAAELENTSMAIAALASVFAGASHDQSFVRDVNKFVTACHALRYGAAPEVVQVCGVAVHVMRSEVETTLAFDEVGILMLSQRGTAVWNGKNIWTRLLSNLFGTFESILTIGCGVTSDNLQSTLLTIRAWMVENEAKGLGFGLLLDCYTKELANGEQSQDGSFEIPVVERVIEEIRAWDCHEDTYDAKTVRQLAWVLALLRSRQGSRTVPALAVIRSELKAFSGK